MQILVWALLMLSIWALKVKHSKTKAAADQPRWWTQFVLSHGWFVLPLCFLGVYILYHCSMFSTEGTAAFLNNACEESKIKDFVQQMRLQPPALQFTAECYHYEHRTSTDAQGNSSTRSVKVVSHQATEGYAFKEWEDKTAAIEGLNEVNMTKVHLSKALEFLTATAEREYEAAFLDFQNRNKMDTHQSYSKPINIEGFKERLLCVSDQFQGHCLATATGYRIATVLLLNVPYRIWFDLCTGVVRLSVVKRIS